MAECIFVGRPPECSTCLDAQLPKCLRFHRHLILTEAGKERVLAYVTAEMSNPERHKTVSGQPQRKDGGI